MRAAAACVRAWKAPRWGSLLCYAHMPTQSIMPHASVLHIREQHQYQGKSVEAEPIMRARAVVRDSCRERKG